MTAAGWAGGLGWADGPLCSFDLESTSADPEAARIVTATVVRIWPGTDPIVRNWLVAVDEAIPAEATEVHGVTTEYAQSNGRPLVEVVEEISEELAGAWELLRMPVIAFNASYDLTVLCRERQRCGLRGLRVSPDYTPVVDPLVLDRRVDRYRRGKRTLTAACEHYGVELLDAHTSAADALAAARVAWCIARRHPEIGRLPLAELHTAQCGWHAEAQRSFADYLRTKIATKVLAEAVAAAGQERAAKLAELPDLLDRADTVDDEADSWPLRNAAVHETGGVTT